MCVCVCDRLGQSLRQITCFPTRAAVAVSMAWLTSFQYVETPTVPLGNLSVFDQPSACQQSQPEAHKRHDSLVVIGDEASFCPGSDDLDSAPYLGTSL